ncbi:PrsW family glutamic-type intramembrane protease [Parafrankia sp. FMc2]|uniref:PrsW family glutamic-type intramembrane protease n=1 Tax=Parafrankia sp. FMc2 TaxID=3233196 RepID=UPI0034D54306
MPIAPVGSRAVGGDEHSLAVALRVLLIARVATGLYLVEVLLNLTRPRRLPDEPSLTILARLPEISGSFGRLLATPRAVFWTVLAGILVGVALQVYSMVRPVEENRAAAFAWLTAVAMVGPFALIPLTVMGSYPEIALACVPSTVSVLWLLHNSQRFARLPAAALVAAFGWGALVISGFTRACNGLLYGAVNAYLIDPGQAAGVPTADVGTSLGAQLDVQERALDILMLHHSVLSQLGVAGGVGALFLVLRRRVIDVVTGLVLGAAVGLGFAFSDSVLFVKLFGSLGLINGATGGFEYWIRQSVGLLGGPVAFGAVLGAGLGVAAQVRERRTRLGVVGAALTAAIGGSMATETLSAWFSRLADVEIGTALDTLVVSPALWLAVQVPFVVLAVLLLRAGRRGRAGAAQVAVAAEAAATESGAGGVVTAREVPFLVDPALRGWAVFGTWQRYGWSAAIALYRLQSAQLDVAGWRWQLWLRQGAGPAADGRTGQLRAEAVRRRIAFARTGAS